MFIWARLPESYGAAGEAGRARDFAHDLLLNAGVAVIPGDAFGRQGEGFVRIALVEEEERLLEAARRIGGFVRKNS
jgi:aspartate/methionine/tyrosine aminotransferase